MSTLPADFLNWLQGLFNTLVPERMGASGEMLESIAPRTIVGAMATLNIKIRNLSTKNVVIIGEPPAVGRELRFT
ncbi:MAG: hypothetical protein R3C68_15945 [Myxococcota bacterium]